MRLYEAMKELEDEGVFAPQSAFWCCMSCGNAAVPKDKEECLFFHDQDAESAFMSRSVHLAWTGRGQHFVDTLKKHGCEVVWNGSESQKIEVLLTEDEATAVAAIRWDDQDYG